VHLRGGVLHLPGILKTAKIGKNFNPVVNAELEPADSYGWKGFRQHSPDIKPRECMHGQRQPFAGIRKEEQKAQAVRWTPDFGRPDKVELPGWEAPYQEQDDGWEATSIRGGI
jgi:hypothetical protein